MYSFLIVLPIDSPVPSDRVAVWTPQPLTFSMFKRFLCKDAVESAEQAVELLDQFSVSLASMFERSFGFRSQETQEHIRRVSLYSGELAELFPCFAFPVRNTLRLAFLLSHVTLSNSPRLRNNILLRST